MILPTSQPDGTASPDAADARPGKGGAGPVVSSGGGGAPIRLALVGNPNTGKTSLFNHLCGLSAKTANFPGTTASLRRGRSSLLEAGGEPAAESGALSSVEVLDLPGLYSLGLDLPEARLVRSALDGSAVETPDAVVVVVDAANLPRNLRLVAEVLPYRLPTVVALNMMDLATRQGIHIDVNLLVEELGCPVVPIMARRGTGLEELRDALRRTLTAPLSPRPSVPEALAGLPPAGRGAAPEAAMDIREDWAEEVADRTAVSLPDDLDGPSWAERLDHLFTHPVWGLGVFGLVMTGLFWTLFQFATVPMDLIEASFGVLGGWVAQVVPEGPLQDFLVEGVVGGVAGTVVFLPQICLLFFLISLLEDTGYLARAAFVMDRLLRRFGLPGHAFVPLLSSHACALPGILSARLIPDRHDRLATILVAPFMSCSARLPVYVLLTGLLFADKPLWAGIAFAGCYVLGALVALASAAIFRKTLLKGPSRPMILELPTYKWPSLRTALIEAKDQGLSFLRKAGTVILGICMAMWWLSAYPETPPPPEAQTLRADAAAVRGADPARAEELEAYADLLSERSSEAGSFAGRIGRSIQPVFAPLGYDWQLTVGVLTSFAAREVFVSTMAVLLVGDSEADIEETGVLSQIRSARRDDGRPVFSFATSASLLIFFVLAMQCLPTLALTLRETGSWKWAALQLGYMTGVAYLAAFLVYQGLHLAGFS